MGQISIFFVIRSKNYDPRCKGSRMSFSGCVPILSVTLNHVLHCIVSPRTGLVVFCLAGAGDASFALVSCVVSFVGSVSCPGTLFAHVSAVWSVWLFCWSHL